MNTLNMINNLYIYLEKNKTNDLFEDMVKDVIFDEDEKNIQIRLYDLCITYGVDVSCVDFIMLSHFV